MDCCSRWRFAGIACWQTLLFRQYELAKLCLLYPARCSHGSGRNRAVTQFPYLLSFQNYQSLPSARFVRSCPFTYARVMRLSAFVPFNSTRCGIVVPQLERRRYNPLHAVNALEITAAYVSPFSRSSQTSRRSSEVMAGLSASLREGVAKTVGRRA